MMNQGEEVILTMIGFRVDPFDLEIFDKEIAKTQTTRSELLRAIFNNYINNLKQQNGNKDFNCTVERQRTNESD